MKREEVFNFSAGPSVLPREALERAAAEILNYNGSGMSVMEMSHRSSFFQEIFDDTKAKLKKALYRYQPLEAGEILKLLSWERRPAFQFVDGKARPRKDTCDLWITDYELVM